MFMLSVIVFELNAKNSKTIIYGKILTFLRHGTREKQSFIRVYYYLHTIIKLSLNDLLIIMNKTAGTSLKILQVKK